MELSDFIAVTLFLSCLSSLPNVLFSVFPPLNENKSFIGFNRQYMDGNQDLRVL